MLVHPAGGSIAGLEEEFSLGSVVITGYFKFYLTRGAQKISQLAVVRMQLREVELRRSLKTPPSDVDPDKDLVVVYNRVPKTGSTSLVGVAYDLCKLNNFHVLHLNITGNMHVLSLANQLRFVQNVTRWTSIKPAFYHGHVAFVDFG
ncbi:unnamed protein product, partial [Timema podura]|nr:unnamed protein product [Timema podura]